MYMVNKSRFWCFSAIFKLLDTKHFGSKAPRCCFAVLQRSWKHWNIKTLNELSRKSSFLLPLSVSVVNASSLTLMTFYSLSSLRSSHFKYLFKTLSAQRPLRKLMFLREIFLRFQFQLISIICYYSFDAFKC